MNEQGEIYSAPADQIPTADVARLKDFLDRASEKLPESGGKVPASAISALFEQIREEHVRARLKQLEFTFDGGTF